ncbi:unnamed protein product [Didymodactylos carnosus]|uniref:Caffeoyl-CoA O-methyltransferase n=1 Tax=Didymodactylos carnosus TaxID=1234261 RepID=A0A8S2PIQ1_9BILA|nr:unnamed protein product [Didymodactylos carnosus]CAF4052575.1 unnamed protein product [Didymodactylos carnosus]
MSFDTVPRADQESDVGENSEGKCVDEVLKWLPRKDLWKRAGVDKKVQVRIKPALESLQELLNEEYGENSFDFIFIDADKESYMKYYEISLKLIRPNGLIAVDNTLYQGKILDPNNNEESTKVMRQFNEHIKNDQRIDVSFLRLGDGTTLCRKK